MRKASRTTDTDTIITLMFEVGRVLRQAMLTKDALPLPLSYVETLRFVEEQKHPTMRDIAEYLRVAAPSATAIVEALVGNGFVLRKADEKDRRVVRLSLTAKGAKLLAKAGQAKCRALRGLVDSLSLADRKEFIRILSQIVTQ